MDGTDCWLLSELDDRFKDWAVFSSQFETLAWDANSLTNVKTEAAAWKLSLEMQVETDGEGKTLCYMRRTCLSASMIIEI